MENKGIIYRLASVKRYITKRRRSL
jgi:hypothetical protein